MDHEDDYETLCKAFGDAVYRWPSPYRQPPRWWQRDRRRHEMRLTAGLAAAGLEVELNADFRTRFYDQVRIGQVYEDAGGYLWRCWRAALGLSYMDWTTGNMVDAEN